MSRENIPGMMTRAELEKAINLGEIETVIVAFPDMYGRLMGKRVTGHFFLDRITEGGMHACDYLLACDMEMNPVPGYKFTSWESGYGDIHCVPDFSSLRRTTWTPHTALLLCDVISEQGNKPVEVSPRQILQRQVKRARDIGCEVMAGSELELYLFEETFETARGKNYHDLKPAGSYIEDYHIFQGSKEEELIGAIRRHMDASGVPVETSKGEWGPGQQEINLEYADVLTMADRHVIYKNAAKEIAHAQGKSVTFMAKWNEKLSGTSMHIHISLWDLDRKENLFAGDGKIGPISCSDEFRWFLGGWMKRIRELSVCYAPYVSSYKRYQAGSFAPTGIAWSYDNRTAGFRVVGRGDSLRIECRVPGADANPYIAFAATIAAGIDGIRNRIEPPPIFQGDIYHAQEIPRVPSTLREAIDAFEQSKFVHEAFGNEVAEHYLHFVKTEQRAFDEVVTCWERARFFERA